MFYVFIFAFSIITSVIKKDKVTLKLTEGITLLQSVAMVYWMIDVRVYETTSNVSKVFMLIGLGFTAFTLFHAFI